METPKRYTNQVKTKLLSSFSKRTLSRSDSEDSNEMSRQLASKTPAGKDRSPKGLMSGSPFNQPIVHEISSVHASDASFRARSLLSGRFSSRNDSSVSQTKFLPNKVESGLSGLNMSDPTREFVDKSGLIVPPDRKSTRLNSSTLVPWDSDPFPLASWTPTVLTFRLNLPSRSSKAFV